MISTVEERRKSGTAFLRFLSAYRNTPPVQNSSKKNRPKMYSCACLIAAPNRSLTFNPPFFSVPGCYYLLLITFYLLLRAFYARLLFPTFRLQILDLEANSVTFNESHLCHCSFFTLHNIKPVLH